MTAAVRPSRPVAAEGTDPGRERENNEDRTLCDPERGIYAVIDGVGGESGGEVAAQAAVEILRARLSRRTTDLDRLVREAIAQANRQIYERAQADPRLAGMSCVLTVAIVDADRGDRATVGHVGDSRLYRLRRGKIEKITRDHSPVGAREDAGEISEDEAMHHPRRNEIFRDVGSAPHEPDEEGFIDTHDIPFGPDDALLFCSDGLSDMVTSARLREIVEGYAGDPKTAIERLIEAANEAGGKDNISAVLVEGARYAAIPAIPAIRRTAPKGISGTGGTPTRPFGSAHARVPLWRRALPWLLLLTVLAAAAVIYLSPDLRQRLLALWPRGVPGPLETPTPTPETQSVIRVGPGETDDYATIGEALAQARSGQTVEVAPGEYREAVELPDGVALVSLQPRGAVLRPPSPETEAVVTARGVAGRISGFRIAGEKSAALGRGPPSRRLAGPGHGDGDLGRHGGRDRDHGRGPVVDRNQLRPRQHRPRHPRVGRRRDEDPEKPDLEKRQGEDEGAGRGDPGRRAAAADRQQIRRQCRGRRLAAGGRARRRDLQLEPFRRVRAGQGRAGRAAGGHTGTGGRGDKVMLTQAQVGRFAIRDFLGRGANGDVYLAWDPGLESEIALKLVRTARTDPDAVAAERNGTTLQAALAKVAPQVAAVYEQGDQDGFFWVAMEYISGDDLAALIEREAPFAEPRAVGIALQLCEMLETFHEFSAAGLDGRRGIVHGDLKPENIRLQEGDRVRVLDFGIAKHLSQTRKFTVNLFGSLPYVPPERLNTGRLDPQSDLWAVAVTLYTMIAGYPPWPGKDPEELETRLRRGDAPAPLPQTVSPGLKKIVYRALAFEPERRYPSAAAFRADLEAWRDGKLPEARDAAAPIPPAELSATRRTVHSLDDSRASGETRKTDTPAVPNGSTHRTYEPPPPPPVPLLDALPEIAGPQPAAEPRTPLWRRRAAIALIGAVLILLGISQIYVQSEASELRHDLVTDTDPDLAGILERYRKISWIGLFNPALHSVRDELREALIHQADRIIEGYHEEYPRVRERGWQQAYQDLQGAMELNYLDRRTRAKMLYTKAHLDRIASQPLSEQGKKAEAEEKIDAAVAGFQDAARRDDKWPDPYLGLARVYAYERPNLESFQKALVELERRGYRLGRRERAMEGDGYRRQAELLWARSVQARGTDAETELLEQTRDNLLQAMNFYDDAAGYGDVAANRARAESRLALVQRRLQGFRADEPGVLDQLDQIFHQIEGASRQR